MPFAYPSILEFGPEAAAQVLARGFSDYFVPIAANPEVLLGMARADSVDLNVSRVVLLDGQPVAAALIARRERRSSRLAGMAVGPEARHRGVGRALMAQLLDEAKTRGERTMVLEVIEQNAPAGRLYENCGFRKIRRRTGHAGRPAAPADDAALEEIDPRELAAMASEHGRPDLPWQISPETIAHATPPAVAWRFGASAVLISNPAADTIGIRALITRRDRRGRGSSRTLLRAVMARYPGKEWRAPAIFPEEMGEAFMTAGLARTALSQWQMTRPLA